MPGSSQPCYNAAKLTISTFFSKGENSELGETRFSLPQLFAGKAALVCLSCVSNWKISKATVKLPLIFDGAPLLSVDLMEQAKPLLLKLLVLPSSAFYPTTTRNLYAKVRSTGELWFTWLAAMTAPIPSNDAAAQVLTGLSMIARPTIVLSSAPMSWISCTNSLALTASAPLTPSFKMP